MLKKDFKLNIKGLIKKLFLGEKSYLLLCFGIPALTMYVIYLALGVHPFGEGSVLVLDLNAQYVYFYEALREFVWGDQSLLYSFSRQLGGEFMGIYAYYLASPLSYIVALFPKTKILEALLSVFLLKTGLCGASFGFYLHKTTKPEDRKRTSIVAFSIMYALCSYAIVHQSNSMWIDALIWLPILTYAIEELIKYRRFKLFVISLAMTVMSNYYIGYMVCFYVALYFFYYYVAHSYESRNNPLDEKAHFIKSLIRIGCYSVLAIGISAVIVFTAYYSLTFGKMEFDDPEWKIKLRMDLMDLITKLLPGSYDTVRRSGLPFIYCGVMALLMLPIYYISNKISTREKMMSGVIMSVFVISFMINVVDLVWHGFSEPNWLNYRYSFMLSFLMLVFAYKGFCDIENVSTKVPLTVAGFISLFLIVAQKYVFPSYNSEEGAKLDMIQCVGFTFVTLAVYLAILAEYKKSNKKQAVAILMVFVVAIEMCANGISNVSGFAYDVAYSSYDSYNDFINDLRPVTDAVQDADTSFYRMEKLDHRSTNDNMALNIRGLSNSSSTLNSETVELLRHMGYFSAYHKSSYIGGNPVSDSLLGLRYIIANNEKADPEEDDEIDYEKENTKELLDKYYELYLSEGNYSAYYNPYALSIAFGVSSDVLYYSFIDDDGDDVNYAPYINLNEMVTALLGKGETVEIFKDVGFVSSSTSYCNTTHVDGHFKYVPKDSDSTASVTYEFTTDRSGDVYFHIPSRYHREVDIFLNGDRYGTFYLDDTPRGFYLGYFEEGEKIKLKITIRSEAFYVANGEALFYYFDESLFKESFDELSRTQMVMDSDHEEDHITGTVETAIEDQLIMTTIPYDEGWKITVDGKEVELIKTLDSLISFNIADAGKHTVEFKYRSDAFVYGIICSIASTVVFVLLVVFDKRINSFIYGKTKKEEAICTNNTQNEILTNNNDGE